MYASREEAKQNGWFSRRHETEAAHKESTKTNHQRKFEKRLGAEERAEARQSRSDEEQLDLLESRGHGHCGEAQTLRLKIMNQAK